MVQSTSVTSAPATAPSSWQYNYATGNLRAFLVALVVAHHTALGYFPLTLPHQSTLLKSPRLWLTFPVLDAHHWVFTAPFVAFNDSFFMSLMFLVSGLFFWHGLARKGVSSFLRDRFLRLGLPFVVAVVLFAPVAYYPSYLQTSAHGGFADFWRQWRSLEMWPGGPAWFLWVLLTFDAVSALLFSKRPAWASALGRFTERLSGRPLVAGLALVATSAVVYIPLTLLFTANSWTTFGPFAFQTSRILHYFVYFLFGVALGIAGVDRGLLAPGGRLASAWWVASGAAVVIFALLKMLIPFARTHGNSALLAGGFVVSCAFSSFACLAVFVRFMQVRRPFWDSLARNSFGIYLLHYMFVSWLQYAMLPATVPGFAKFFIVFVGALVLSWISMTTLRRIPAIARIV